METKIMWRVHYEEENDSFVLQLSEDGGNDWSYVMGQSCIDGELVTYKFLTQIREFNKMGFVPYKGKW